MTEQENKSMQGLITQEEAQYVPLSTSRGKACANCRWFMPNGEFGAACHIVASYPEAILATGVSNRWEAVPQPVQAEVEAIPVVIVEPEYDELAVAQQGKAGAMLNRENKRVLQSVYEGIRGILKKAGLFEDDEDESDLEKGRFFVFKAGDSWYWKAVWSNDFKDRDDEILSRKAHDKYIARLDAQLTPLPELWYWHTKGTAHGKALWVERVGHLMLAVGKFDESEMAQKFLAHYRKSKEKYGVSHGFTFPNWAKKQGVYEDYNTFEISPLPIDVAANPYTTFEEINKMTVDESKRQKLEAILGKELATNLLANTEKVSKELEDAGLTYKDFADLPAAEAAAKETDGSPLLGKLILALITSQAQQVEDGAARDAQVKELQTGIATVVAENQKLRAQMELTPRASVNPNTILQDDVIQQKLTEKSEDYDDVWASVGLKVAKKVNNDNGH